MTRVKVCGLCRVEDVELALGLGAHALGFIFEPSSPRYIGDDREIIRLPKTFGPYATSVAVYGNLPAVFRHECQVVQFAEGCWREHGTRFVRAIRFREPKTLLEAKNMIEGALKSCTGAEALLLDAFDPNAYGGTGKRVDWDLAAELVQSLTVPVILAGGLTPENVGEAIAKVRPYSVDVSSGIESEPRKKDPHKVRDFIQAALDFAPGI